MEIALVLMLALVLANGVFAMTEAAVISSRRARVEAVAARGSGRAKGLLRLMDDPTRFLSTVQVGITLIGILSGALGEKVIADRIEPHLTGLPLIGRHAGIASSVVMAMAVGYVSLILGELVPKRLALARPEAIASVMARPMIVLSLIASPLVWLLSVSSEVVMAFLPRAKAEDHGGTEDEVKSLMRTGTEAGVFHESEQRIVERVFRLSDQSIKSLMVPRTDIDWLHADDSAERVRVAVATSSHSHFPVCKPGGDLDDLLGVVHLKDLVKSGLISEGVNLGEIARAPVFVPETTTPLKVLEVFKKTGDHIVFVLDEYGAVEGLVTLNDLVEAIVGEVTAKQSADEPMIVRRTDGSYLLDGMLGVTELKELVYPGRSDALLPKENDAAFETLGGFCMAYLGRIPTTGDSFEFDGARLEVMDMDKQRVDKVLLTIREPLSEPGTTASLGE